MNKIIKILEEHMEELKKNIMLKSLDYLDHLLEGNKEKKAMLMFL